MAKEVLVMHVYPYSFILKSVLTQPDGYAFYLSIRRSNFSSSDVLCLPTTPLKTSISPFLSYFSLFVLPPLSISHLSISPCFCIFDSPYMVVDSVIDPIISPIQTSRVSCSSLWDLYKYWGMWFILTTRLTCYRAGPLTHPHVGLHPRFSTYSVIYFHMNDNLSRNINFWILEDLHLNASLCVWNFMYIWNKGPTSSKIWPLLNIRLYYNWLYTYCTSYPFPAPGDRISNLIERYVLGKLSSMLKSPVTVVWILVPPRSVWIFFSPDLSSNFFLKVRHIPLFCLYHLVNISFM